MNIPSPFKVMLALALATGISQGAVLIGNGVNNGEVTAPGTGWPFGDFSIGGDSDRTDGPFGAQSAGSGSLYVSRSTNLLSNIFALNAGDQLTFAFDYRSLHSQGVFISIELVGVYVTYRQTLEEFTDHPGSAFALDEIHTTFNGPTSDYFLAIEIDPFTPESDINLDRIYLANDVAETVPEPSGALLMSAGLGLALLRRKRRDA